MASAIHKCYCMEAREEISSLLMRQLTFRVGSTERIAYQFLEKGSTGSQSAVIALHGAGGHPLIFRRMSRLDYALSGHASIIFLAAEKQSRLSRWSLDSESDYDFLLSVFDYLQSQDISTKNIHVVGMSNGGCLGHLFSSTCGFQFGNLVTVCSAMPMQLGSHTQAAGSLTGPKSVFIANSMYDAIIPYKGGYLHSDIPYEVCSHKQTVDYWISRLRCNELSVFSSPIYAELQRAEASLFKYYTSDADNKVLSLTSVSSSHCWSLISDACNHGGSKQRSIRRILPPPSRNNPDHLPLITQLTAKFISQK